MSIIWRERRSSSRRERSERHQGHEGEEECEHHLEGEECERHQGHEGEEERELPPGAHGMSEQCCSTLS